MLIPVSYIDNSTYLCVDTDLLPGTSGFDNQVRAKTEDINGQKLTRAQQNILFKAYHVVDERKNNALPLYCYGKVKQLGKKNYKFVIDDIICVNKTGNKDMLNELYKLTDAQVAQKLECRGLSIMEMKFVGMDRETFTPMIFVDPERNARMDAVISQLGMITNFVTSPSAGDVTQSYFDITSVFMGETEASRLACKLIELNKTIGLDIESFKYSGTRHQCGETMYKAYFPSKDFDDVDKSISDLTELSCFSGLGGWVFVMVYLSLCAYVLKGSGKFRWFLYTADLRRFYDSVGVGRKESTEFEDTLMFFGQGVDCPRLLVDKNRLTGVYLTQQLIRGLEGAQFIGIGLNGFKTVGNGSLIKSDSIVYKVDSAVQFSKKPFGQQGVKDNKFSIHFGSGCECNFILEPFSNWDSVLGLVELDSPEPVNVLIDIDRFAKVGKLSEFLVWFFNSMSTGLELIKFDRPEFKIILCKDLVELPDGIGVQEYNNYTELIELNYTGGVAYECGGITMLNQRDRRALKAQIVKAMIDSLGLARFTGGEASVKVQLMAERNIIGYSTYWSRASLNRDIWMSATGKHIIANKQKYGYKRKFLRPVVMRAEEDFLNVCGLYGKFVSLFVNIGTVSRESSGEATTQLLMCRGLEAIQNEFIRVTKYPVSTVIWGRLKVLNIDEFAIGLHRILNDNDGVARIKYKALDLTWLKEYADSLINGLCKDCGLYEH